jgi:hypothetical protein
MNENLKGSIKYAKMSFYVKHVLIVQSPVCGCTNFVSVCGYCLSPFNLRFDSSISPKMNFLPTATLLLGYKITSQPPRAFPSYSQSHYIGTISVVRV